MNSRFTRKNHSIDSLAALLLFAMYVLFLLFLMLFGAGNYQASVKSLDTNNNLYTAVLLHHYQVSSARYSWKNLPYRASGNTGSLLSGNY